MRRHTETYEHVGEVSGWVEDLEQAWRAHREKKRVYVDEEQAAFSYSVFLPAPPELVWEYISSPLHRAKWGMGLDRVDQLDPTGRRRQGTLNHCMHGEQVILQEFIDWQPPRYYTSKATLPGGFSVISTHEVEAVEGGTNARPVSENPDQQPPGAREQSRRCSIMESRQRDPLLCAPRSDEFCGANLKGDTEVDEEVPGDRVNESEAEKSRADGCLRSRI